MTSLLTLYAVVRTWSLAFWRTPQQAHEMAFALSEPSPADTAGVAAHPGRFRLGVVTFAAGDLDEVRRDHGPDAPDRDLYQLLRDGELPRAAALVDDAARDGPHRVQPGADHPRRPTVRLHRPRRRGFAAA